MNYIHSGSPKFNSAFRHTAVRYICERVDVWMVFTCAEQCQLVQFNLIYAYQIQFLDSWLISLKFNSNLEKSQRFWAMQVFNINFLCWFDTFNDRTTLFLPACHIHPGFIHGSILQAVDFSMDVQRLSHWILQVLCLEFSSLLCYSTHVCMVLIAMFHWIAYDCYYYRMRIRI